MNHILPVLLSSRETHLKHFLIKIICISVDLTILVIDMNSITIIEPINFTSFSFENLSLRHSYMNHSLVIK